MFNHPSVNIAGRSQMTIAAASQTPPLEAGVYNVWNASDTYVKVSKETASDVTSSTGYFVPSGSVVSLVIAAGGYKIGASDGASIHRVE